MSADRIELWARALAELVDVGAGMAQAIEHDDVLGAIAAGLEARRIRGRLAWIAPAAPEHAAELAAMADARALIAQARGAEQILERWAARPLPPDQELVKSPLGAAVLAEAMLPASWDFDADLVVLIGDGLDGVGEVLSALGQRRIMVIEPEGAPVAVAPAWAAIARTDDEIARAVRTMDPLPPQRVAVRALGDDAPARATAIAEVVRTTLSDLRVHRNTIAAFSRTWIAQGAANLPAIARWPTIAAVGDRFAGVPMIIAAPGPSLARNVALLRAAKGRALIAGLSHSLKPLIAAGVVPDLIFTVDPQDVRYHFEGIDLAQVAACVQGVTVHPKLFELGAPAYLTLAANCALDQWAYAGLGEEAEAGGGGSVATSALAVALRWRCDPVIFVGLDLSWAGDRYYVATSCDGGARAEVTADGTVAVAGWSASFHAMKAGGGPRVPRERVVELPGWAGGTVQTSYIFSLFHRWFVDVARRTTAVRLLNCTEGGAHIEGMTHVPLATALAELGDRAVDARAVIADVRAATDVPGRAARLRDRTRELLHGLDRAAALARRCRRQAAGALTSPGAMARLERSERALAKALAPLGFVSMLAQREIASASSVAMRPGAVADYLAASLALFEAVAVTVATVRPHLAGSLAALDVLAAEVQHGRAG